MRILAALKGCLRRRRLRRLVLELVTECDRLGERELGTDLVRAYDQWEDRPPPAGDGGAH